MGVILKPLFEILTGDVAVCDNILLNYIIMLVVGEISIQTAYCLVGDAYRNRIIGGKSVGSILHWIIRLVIYVLVAYLLRAIIAIYNFFAGAPGWVWLCILGVIVCLLGTALAYTLYRKRRPKLP